MFTITPAQWAKKTPNKGTMDLIVDFISIHNRFISSSLVSQKNVAFTYLEELKDIIKPYGYLVTYTLSGQVKLVITKDRYDSLEKTSTRSYKGKIYTSKGIVETNTPYEFTIQK